MEGMDTRPDEDTKDFRPENILISLSQPIVKVDGEGDAASEEAQSDVLPVELYTSLCKRLNMDETTAGLAWRLLSALAISHSSKFRDVGEKTLKTWFAAALYFAGRTPSPAAAEQPPMLATVNGVTVSHLLRAADASMIEFLDVLKTVLRLHETTPGAPEISKPVAHGVILLQRKFCILTALFQKFTQAFEKVFIVGGEEVGALISLTWTVFIVIKARYASEAASTEQLLLLYQLLLCCVNHTIVHAPRHTLRPQYQHMSAVDEHGRGAAGKDDIDARSLASLKELCTMFDLQQTDIESVNGVFVEEFKRSGCAVASPPYPLGHRLEAANRLYEAVYVQTGDMDERLWLNHDPQVKTPSRPHALSSAIIVAAPQCTPIRAAVKSVQDLKVILEKSDSAPSEALRVFFRACAVDPHEAIEAGVAAMQDRFVAAYSAATSHAATAAQIAPQRFKLAATLYYRVMEEMLTSERERLRQTSFDAMLHNHIYHSSLLACCLEIVLFTYGVSWEDQVAGEDSSVSPTAFPWILSVASLHAYDFFKVIESVVRCEPALSEHIRRHLSDLEQRVVCCLAWTHTSPLFPSLDNLPAVPDVKSTVLPDHPPPGATPSGSSASVSGIASVRAASALHVFSSPRKPLRKALGGAGLRSAPGEDGSPGPNLAAPHPAPPPARSVSLDVFFRKFYRLADIRLQKLMTALTIPDYLHNTIFGTFEHSVTKHVNLMRERHMDNLLVCAIYAICKVSLKPEDGDFSFKNIVNVYTGIFDKQKNVLRHVDLTPLPDGPDGGASAASGEAARGNIVRFYNDIFMPVMKEFILQQTPGAGGSGGGGHLPSPGFKQYKLPGSQIYLSPLHSRIDHRTLTPKTKSLLSFTESPSRSREQLELINQAINSSEKKRLSFEQDGGPQQKRPMYSKFKSLSGSKPE